MFIVQPVAFGASDEELTAISVFATVSHREQTRCVMLQSKVLIFEFLFSVDTHATCAIIIQEISSLDHEVFDYSMERAIFIP